MGIIILYVTYLLLFHFRIKKDPIYCLPILFLETFINLILYSPASITVSSITVNTGDILFVYLMLIIFSRRKRIFFKLKHQWSARYLAFIFFYSLMSVFLFSLVENKPIISTINQSRQFLLFLPFFLYFYSFEYNNLFWLRFRKVALFFYAFYLIFGLIVFLNSGFERVIPAGGALVFAYGFLLFFNLKGNKNWVYTLLYFLLFLMVILLRHRSVWIGLAMGSLYMIYYQGISRKIVTLLLVGFLVVFLGSFFFSQQTSIILSQLQESVSPFESEAGFEDSTGGGRVRRWKAQLEENFNFQVALIGLGHAYNREVTFVGLRGGVFTSNVSFHNQYLEQMFRIGGISVLLLLASFFSFFKALRKHYRASNNVIYIYFGAILICTMSFGFAYSFISELFIFLGIGFSIVHPQVNPD